MSESTAWKPSAPLAAATLACLNALARRWPKAMASALSSDQAAQENMADFAYAFFKRGVDLRAIPMAAREWVSEHATPPQPADIAAMARELTAKHFPNHFRSDAPTAPESEEHDFGKNLKAIDTLGHRAHAQLGNWPLVAEVWALLWHTAPTDDQRFALRNGNVPYDVFDDAIAAVKRGNRAPSFAPLSTLVEPAWRSSSERPTARVV